MPERGAETRKCPERGAETRKPPLTQVQGEIPRSGRAVPAVTTALAGGQPWVRTCFRSSHPSECEHSIAATTAAPLAPCFALDIGLEVTVSSWAGSSQGYPSGNVQLKLSLSSTANGQFTCQDYKHKTPTSPSLTLSGYQVKDFPSKHS